MLLPETAGFPNYNSGETHYIPFGRFKNSTLSQIGILIYGTDGLEVVDPQGTAVFQFYYFDSSRAISPSVDSIDLAADYVLVPNIAFVSGVGITVNGLAVDTFWNPKIIVNGAV